jgi:hypothetical protein
MLSNGCAVLAVPSLSDKSDSKWEEDVHAQLFLLSNQFNLLSLLFFLVKKPLPPLPPLALPTSTTTTMLNQQKSASIHQGNNALATAPISTSIKTATPAPSTTTPTGVVKPTPSIAVTHTQSIEREEAVLLSLASHVRAMSPSKRKELKKFMQQKSKHSAFDKYQR